ncbi:acyltransferase family protein [Barnesiella intestinihominis]|uniref:acyltransferase family protein n=1 Tax=Barnesiella intestinihominis TaxID=487174 RepID=UPI003967D190
MNTGKRILWIDYAKSICIYLVLLGHAHASQPVTDFIYTFHMPLFFFLSGCLFSFEKHPNFKEFAIKRFKGLMVPYLWINLITYLFWLFAGRNFGEDATISTTWYSPIIGILLGYSKQMIHNTPMWFFICLYFLEIFYYLLFKPLQKKSKSIKISVLIVIAVIGYINYAYNPYTLPFCLGTAIVGMVLYGIGNLIVHNIQITKIKLLHIILVFLTMGIVIFIAHENGYIIMATNNYNNYILFFIGSFAGICMINLSSNFLSLKPVFQNIIIYISKNTLIINSFHLLTFSFLKGIMVFIFHIPVETLYGKIVPNIVFALVSLFSCLPIAYIINKHFPFIIGKKRSPEG